MEQPVRKFSRRSMLPLMRGGLTNELLLLRLQSPLGMFPTGSQAQALSSFRRVHHGNCSSAPSSSSPVFPSSSLTRFHGRLRPSVLVPDETHTTLSRPTSQSRSVIPPTLREASHAILLNPSLSLPPYLRVAEDSTPNTREFAIQ